MLIQFLTGWLVKNIQCVSMSEVGTASRVLRGLRSWEEQDSAYFLIQDSRNTFKQLCWASQYTINLMQIHCIQLSIRLKPLRRTCSVLKVSVFVRESILARPRTEIKMWSQVFGYVTTFFFPSRRSVLDKSYTHDWGTTSSDLWLTFQWMHDIINFGTCIIRSFNFKVIVKKNHVTHYESNDKFLIIPLCQLHLSDPSRIQKFNWEIFI